MMSPIELGDTQKTSRAKRKRGQSDINIGGNMLYPRFVVYQINAIGVSPTVWLSVDIKVQGRTKSFQGSGGYELAVQD